MKTRSLRSVVALVVALAGGLWACVSAAGETALALPIGYSQNLRYFAFEEVGIQDGSGFAYSNIYMIDISEDRWVVGTPIRMIAEDDTTPLEEVRAQALAEAEAYLNDLSISVPAQLLAANADGEPESDGMSLVFSLPAPSGPGFRKGRYTLSLEQYVSDAGAPCADWFGTDPLGFILTISDLGPPKQVHRDNVLPRSRGCPADYRIHSVYAPFQATDISHTLALISVYANGYEGLDRRFIGVALAKSRIEP